MAQPARMPMADNWRDLEILNRSVRVEQQGIWVYEVAAGHLSTVDVGKGVLALGLENQADHRAHLDGLADAVRELGGTPAPPESSYPLSSYLRAGEGDLDSDINIAKFALALEIDAVVAHARDAAQLATPRFVELSAGIASVEAVHAARIRRAMRDIGLDVPVVPSPVISSETRHLWVLKV